MGEARLWLPFKSLPGIISQTVEYLVVVLTSPIFTENTFKKSKVLEVIQAAQQYRTPTVIIEEGKLFQAGFRFLEGVRSILTSV